MGVPNLTHLQYLVLAHLTAAARTGNELRSVLKQHGVQQSGPAFYQLMGRLERSSLVRGKYQPSGAGGHTCRERRYQITSAGVDAWEQALAFYLGTLEAVARDRRRGDRSAPFVIPSDPMGILR